MTDEPKPVARLADAKLGDWVWVYASQANRYDAQGRYEGRGTYTLEQLEQETRQSWIVRTRKFDRATGRERVSKQWSPQFFLFGDEEKRERIWIGKYQHRLVSELQGTRDFETLMKIAAVLKPEMLDDL